MSSRTSVNGMSLYPAIPVRKLTLYLSYAVWFGGSLMASLVSGVLLVLRGPFSYKCSMSARVLLVLPHEGAIRRDRSQHLQTLPDLRQRDLGIDRTRMDVLYVMIRNEIQCTLLLGRPQHPARDFAPTPSYYTLGRTFTWNHTTGLFRDLSRIHSNRAALLYISWNSGAQLEQLHWKPSSFLSPMPQYRRSSRVSASSSSSLCSWSSPPHGSNGLQAICQDT